MRPFCLALFLALPSAAASPPISWFEQSGKTCAWLRAVPGALGRPVEVARFEGSCEFGVAVRWSPDFTRALVQVSEPTALHEVRTATGKHEVVPLPDGRLDDFGYDAAGQTWALTTQDFPQGPGGAAVTELFFEGKRIAAADSIGWPALAHAQVLLAGTRSWKRVETEPTGIDACSAPGVSVLKSWSSIIRRPDEWGHELSDALGARLAALAPLPDDPEGEWRQVREAFVWYSQFGDFMHPTGRIAVERGGLKLVETGSSAAEPLTVEVRPGFLLLNRPSAGARVIDLMTGAAVFSNERARGAAFWPART